MKKLIILSVLLISSSLASAQDVTSRSKIRLDDGSELEVLIIENIPGKFIKIELPGNGVATIDYKNIVSIRHKSFTYHSKFKLPRGFYLTGSFDFLIGKSSEYSSARLGIGLGATGNYRFNSYLSLGLGGEVTALLKSGGSLSYPVYARLSGSSIERRVAPVYILDAGWSFIGNGQTENTEITGGWFLRPALGVRINMMTVSLGYQLQNVTTTTQNFWWWGGGGQELVEERLMKNIVFGLNLMF